MIRLFDRTNFSELSCPQNPDAEYAYHYFAPLILEGTKSYIQNVDAKVCLLLINEKLIPIVFSNPGEPNCYVCSSYDQYITYAQEELKTLNSPIIEVSMRIFLRLLGCFLKMTDFNKVIFINNWLLSTNLYVDLTHDEIQDISKYLGELNPGHLIVYRSLNKYTNSKLIRNLETLGAKKILSRQVYVTDPNFPEYKKRKVFKQDQAFLRRSEGQFRVPTMRPEDIRAIKSCYEELYISKYSTLNPQFTDKFFINGIGRKLFNFLVWDDGNEIKAVLGYFKRNGVMTTPIFGFRTNAPKDKGYYRIISSKLMIESEKEQLILNQSSGAAEFKRLRGAEAEIEYSYYFDQYANFRQKRSWKILSSILNTFGVFILRKYKL